MISVHIAASSAIVRAGLESVVRGADGLSLASVGSVADLERAIEDQPDGMPADVLLVALLNVTEDWISLLASAGIPAVILAELPENGLFASALRAGIRAILSPDSSPAEIAAAVAAAASGLMTMQPAGLELLLGHGEIQADPLAEPLTPRELEVLALLAEGHSNRLIAQSLGISEHTVKFHVTAIMNKLDAASRTDAVMQAIRRGLVMI